MKIVPRKDQNQETIHITAPCELFVVYDPKHRPVFQIIPSEPGTETIKKEVRSYDPAV